MDHSASQIIAGKTVDANGVHLECACLMTDIEQSVTLERRHGDRYIQAKFHDIDRMREICTKFHGELVQSRGDSLLFTFPTAPDALLAVKEIRETKARDVMDGQLEGLLRHRMVVHYGEFLSRPIGDKQELHGNEVNLMGRLLPEAGGNNVLITKEAFDRREDLVLAVGEPRIVPIRDLGIRMKVFPLGFSLEMKQRELETLFEERSRRRKAEREREREQKQRTALWIRQLVALVALVGCLAALGWMFKKEILSVAADLAPKAGEATAKSAASGGSKGDSDTKKSGATRAGIGGARIPQSTENYVDPDLKKFNSIKDATGPVDDNTTINDPSSEGPSEDRPPIEPENPDAPSELPGGSDSDTL